MNKTTVNTILLVTTAFIIGAGGVFAVNNFDLLPKAAVDTPKPTPKLEIDQILENLKQTIDLPKGEEPSLATVTDPEKLREQTFFKNAETGDKVILYTKSSRAVLYRPKTGKVIEMGPFVLTNPIENPLVGATPPPLK